MEEEAGISPLDRSSFTPVERGELTQKQLQLIKDTFNNDLPVYLYGGYADDVLLNDGQVIRNHSDVDFVAKYEDLERLIEPYESMGYQVEKVRESEELDPYKLKLRQDDVVAEINLLKWDGERHQPYAEKYENGQLIRGYFDSNTFTHPAQKLDGMEVNTVSPLAILQMVNTPRPEHSERNSRLISKYFPNTESDDLKPEMVKTEEASISPEKALEQYLGISTKSEKFSEWKKSNPELSELEILVSCLYNKVTQEQSLWTKREDLTDGLVHELDDYLHETSKITAEIVLSQIATGDDMEKIDALNKRLADKARSEGIIPKEMRGGIEPETNILGFIDLLGQKNTRKYLDGPVLVIGLTTHGNIPAYLVSILLDEKGIDEQVAFIRPTSRDNLKTVDILPRDRVVIEEATPNNILIVDDSIDKGGSMKQSLGYIEEQFDQAVTVCVAVAREQNFLSEIKGEEYSTETHEGQKIYTKASFLKPTSTNGAL